MKKLILAAALVASFGASAEWVTIKKPQPTQEEIEKKRKEKLFNCESKAGMAYAIGLSIYYEQPIEHIRSQCDDRECVSMANEIYNYALLSATYFDFDYKSYSADVFESCMVEK